MLNWLRRIFPSQTEAIPDLESYSSAELATLLRELVDGKVPVSRRASPLRDQNRSKVDRAQSAERCWIPADQPVTLHGRTIPGGLIYVGQGLPALSRHFGVEPALIDPRLPVDKHGLYHSDVGTPYWTSYELLLPESRAAFLGWLAGGRRNPNAPIGHVMLYFYGLERRLLADAVESRHVWAEADAIMAEVQSLVSVYGWSGSFRRYASDFQSAVDALCGGATRVYEDPPPTITRGWTIPARLKVALGQLSADRKPVPAGWALAWLRADPDIRLLTPATRCTEEFDELFLIRYEERYGDGFTVKPNKRRLRASYRPASPSFGGSVRLPGDDLPDITALTGPARKLGEVADRCCVELDAYSRWLGRNPNGRGSLAAAALLPPDLASGQVRELVSNLCLWIEEQLGRGESIAVPASELAARWDPRNKLTKQSFVNLAELLAKRGYGLEPDVRFGGRVTAAGPIVLYRIAEGANRPADSEYTRAQTLVQLVAAVAHAGGEVGELERRRLMNHVEAFVDVAPPHRPRLRAHLLWRLSAGANLVGVKSRLAWIPHEEHPHVGRFLVGVAASNSFVSPSQITMLTKVYRLLGLPEADVYSDVHARTVQPAASEPVTVRAAGRSGGGYRIPRPPSKDGTAQEVTLDSARVEARLADSAAVSALLGAIFLAEEDSPQPPFQPPPRTRRAGSRPRPGLMPHTHRCWRPSPVRRFGGETSSRS